jgi:4-hydroxy-tetrahydrodipicolinate synthase
VPVIAGTGANSTIEAIELTQSAQESGADAVLSVAPYYNKPSPGRAVSTFQGYYRGR